MDLLIYTILKVYNICRFMHTWHLSNQIVQNQRYYKKNINKIIKHMKMLMNKHSKTQQHNNNYNIRSRQNSNDSVQLNARFKDNLLNNYTGPTLNCQSLEQNRMADNKLSYNFTVAVRVKPKITQQMHPPTSFTINNNSSIGKNASTQLQYHTYDNQNLIIQFPQAHSYSSTKNRKFGFNNVFIDKKNRSIYEQLIKQKINVLKQNLNLTVLTYGITGSGKTHTIFGNKDNGKEKDTRANEQQGIATMVFQDVIKQYNNQKQVDLKFSYIQIYNEQVHDLLKQQSISNLITQNQIGINNSQPQLQKLKSLTVLEDSNGQLNIPELSKVSIRSISQIEQLIQKGNNIRACSSNMINKLSSRSHALLQLFCYNQRTKIENVVTIIDLAGSQRHAATSFFGLQLGNNIVRDKSKEKQAANLQKQGSNINRSLLALANCLKALQSGEGHIPYRDSKLTRILKADLSGKSQNVMIACVGRNLSQADQTINTLQYAARAAKIKVQQNKNCAKNGDFLECVYCYKGIPWKHIMKHIPQQYLSQLSGYKLPTFNRTLSLNKSLYDQNYFQDESIEKLFGQNKTSTKNKQLKIRMELVQLFSKFKKDISGLLHNRSTSLYQQQILKQDCLFGACFGNQIQRSNNNRLAIQSINQTQRQNIEAGITDVFNLYEKKIQESIQLCLQTQISKRLSKYVNMNQNKFVNANETQKLTRTFSQIAKSKNLDNTQKRKLQSQTMNSNPNLNMSKTLSLNLKKNKAKQNILHNSPVKPGSFNDHQNILKDINFKCSLQSFRQMIHNQQCAKSGSVINNNLLRNLKSIKNQKTAQNKSKNIYQISAFNTIKTKATNSECNSNNNSSYLQVNNQSNQNSLPNSNKRAEEEKEMQTQIIDVKSKGPKLQLSLQFPQNISTYTNNNRCRSQSLLKTQRMNPDVCIDVQTQISLEDESGQIQPWSNVYIQKQNSLLTKQIKKRAAEQRRQQRENKIGQQSRIQNQSQQEKRRSMYRKAKQVNRQKRESTSKNKNKSTIMRKIEQAKKMYKIQDQSDKNRQKEEQVKNMGLGQVEFLHQNRSHIQFSLRESQSSEKLTEQALFREIVQPKQQNNLVKNSGANINRKEEIYVSSFMQDQWEESSLNQLKIEAKQKTYQNTEINNQNKISHNISTLITNDKNNMKINRIMADRNCKQATLADIKFNNNAVNNYGNTHVNFNKENNGLINKINIKSNKNYKL